MLGCGICYGLGARTSSESGDVIGAIGQIFAPVFVPIFLRRDVPAQTVLAAYRVARDLDPRCGPGA